MTKFVHGVSLKVDKRGYIPVISPAMAVIGLIATANDADEDFYPLNHGVLITDINEAIMKAGESGTLKAALEDIKKESSPEIVVIRVEEGDTEEDTIANVIGEVTEDGKLTGIEALALASQHAGKTPRILVCPKYDENDAVRLKMANTAKKMFAFTYLSLNDAETIPDAIKAREKLSSGYAMLFYNNALAYDPAIKGEGMRYSVAQIAGLRARLDMERGWHKSISNEVLAEATDVNKPVTFAKINPQGTGANALNAEGISVLVHDGGIKTWGNRTAAADDTSDFFEVANRTESYFAIEAGNFLSNLLQDQPMTPVNIERFAAQYNNVLGAHTQAGRILGGQVVLDPNLNSRDDLMQGKPAWVLEITAVPPIEGPQLTIRLTDRFIMTAVGA